MKKVFALVIYAMMFNIYAAICPDPYTSPLKHGDIPLPWVLNPLSEHRPQEDEDTRFVRVNLLVANIGRGIVCTYQNSVGYYSIFWSVGVKLPAPQENYWRAMALGGFVCDQSISECVFYPAAN